jgi:ribonuclease G
MTKELIVSSTSHESTVALLEDDQLVEIYIARGAQHGLAGSIYKGRVTRVLPGMQSAFVNIGLDRDAFLYVSDFVGEMEDMDEAGADAGALQEIEKAAAKALEAVGEPAEPGDARQPAPPVRGGQRDRERGGEPGAERGGEPGAERGREPGAERGREPGAARGREPGAERGRDAAAERGREPGADRDREPGTQRGAEPGGDRDRDRGGDSEGGGDRRGRRSRRRRGRGGRFPDSKYARVDDKPQAERPAAEVRRPEPEERQRPDSREEESGFTVLPGESLAKYSGPSPRRGDSGDRAEPRPSGRRPWPEDSGDQSEPLAASGEDHDSRETRGRPGFPEPGDEDSNDGFSRTRTRPEYDRTLAGDDEEPGESLETARQQPPYEAPYSEDDEAELDAAENLEDEEDLSNNGFEPGQPGLAAAEDDDEDNGESNGGEMALDAAEAEDVREAIRDALEEEDGEEDADEREARGDDTGEEQGGEEQARGEDAGEEQERDGTQAAGRAPEGGEDGARQASVRGRGGASRYVHRRGGRRGRRRGRPTGAEEPLETESAPRESAQSSPTSITELLSPGQEILVQISKEPLGKKGARITSHIAMPGRYLVYMPTVDHVGVSRKIASDSERLRLRRIVQSHRTGMSGGFIVRTAGSGATEEEIRGDMLFLYNLWLDIRQKAEQRPAPSLIHQDLDIVERVLRDQLGSSFKTMWVDSESEYERILRFVERFLPNMLSRVKLYTRSKPIFDAFNITPELEKALRPKVWLKSGGYIVINQTEALVAIDVNTGKFVGKSDRLEDTIVKTNVEAVQEIVRQIRLRDLGGIIVVDFIDMDDRQNRYKVAQALEQELRLDRAPSKSLQFNEFGLVAITRKRVKQSLERTLCTACPYCTGSGFVKSVETVIFEILSEAKKMAPRVRSRKDLTIRVNPEVARALKSRENSFLQEVEEIFRANVLVRGDVSLHREHFDIN